MLSVNLAITTGVLGNIYTILILVYCKKLYNNCTPYLINVAVSDLVMTGIILPIAGLNGVTGFVNVPSQFCRWLSLLFHVATGRKIGLVELHAHC